MIALMLSNLSRSKATDRCRRQDSTSSLSRHSGSWTTAQSVVSSISPYVHHLASSNYDPGYHRCARHLDQSRQRRVRLRPLKGEEREVICEPREAGSTPLTDSTLTSLDHEARFVPRGSIWVDLRVDSVGGEGEDACRAVWIRYRVQGSCLSFRIVLFVAQLKYS